MPLPRVTYAARVRYAEEGRARHRVSLRRSPLRALHSFVREIADGIREGWLNVAYS